MMGVIGGSIEWLFAFPQPAVGHHQRGRPAGERAARGTCRATSGATSPGGRQREVADGPLPPWQIVRERRATFAATPDRECHAPGPPPSGTTCFWRATGPIRDCPRPSKARSAPAISAADAGARKCVSGQHCTSMTLMTITMPDAARTARGARARIAAASSAVLDIAEARRPLGVRARSRRHDPGRICPAAALFRRAGRTPSWKRKIAVYLRRIQGEHGGWPLFHGGDFDMSASVKAYFALKMIGDCHRRAAHEARARRSSRAAARSRATCSRASCWRCSAS